MDRTKPPPGWYLLDEARGKYIREDGLADLEGAWAEYDEACELAVCAARVELLRALAASLFAKREIVCETDWTKHWREARQIFKTKLEKMADELEASGRTEEP